MEIGNIDTSNTIKRSHLFIGIAFMTFVAGGLIYGLTTNSPDRSKWKKSIGVVEYRTYGRIGTRMFTFKADSRIIREARGGKGFSGECLGDVFELLYNPDNPKEIYVLNYRPLFLKGEAVEETTGSLLQTAKISTKGNYKEAFPLFAYTVNGKKYRRVQMIKVPIDSPLILQKGMQFRVRYWLENPQRSILDYNEPR